MDRLDSTCVVVTARENDKPYGCFATFVTQASIQPRRLAVFTSHENLTHEVIERTGLLIVNVAPADRGDWLRHFGYQSGRTTEKFEAISWQWGDNGCPVLSDAVGYVEGEVVASVDAGDHTAQIVTPTTSRLLHPRQQPLRMMDAVARGLEEPNDPKHWRTLFDWAASKSSRTDKILPLP